MAQRKRAGLITLRSLDRNELMLTFCLLFYYFPLSVSHGQRSMGTPSQGCWWVGLHAVDEPASLPTGQDGDVHANAHPRHSIQLGEVLGKT